MTARSSSSLGPRRHRNTVPALAIALASLALSQASAADASNSRVLSLAGPWRFQLDRADVGVAERWFERALSQRVKLPGSLPAQGIGDDVTVETKWTGSIVDRSWFTAPEYEKHRRPGNVKVPFWLQPEKHYVGPAWYQRDFDIPAKWQGQRVVLSLERPHWETRVWVGSRLVGTNQSLSTPHDYDLGLLPPGKHTLTVRVDNRLVVDVGHDSHSVSDHTQGNWNGIVGRLELRATPPVWIDELQVYPHVATKSVTVKGRIGNATGQPGRSRVVLHTDYAALLQSARAEMKFLDVTWEVEGGTFETTLPLGTSPRLWDEFDPVLFHLSAALAPALATNVNFSNTVTFGLREFAAQGTQFVINGRKTFIRGTLECCIFPKTGHPPTDVAEWKRIIRVAKAHGLNNLRFHSWCPPEAAFVAADELGFYLHVEASSWANASTTLGDGKPVDRWLYEETDRILRYYGNHPSFVLMPYGNEPGGPKHAEFLAKWVEYCKAKDPRRLYTSGAGWPQIAENQWHSSPDPRVQSWGGGLKTRINAKPPETRTDYRDYIGARAVPVISHEIGQWCVYPNFGEMKKYTGYLKPRNFEIFRETLRAHHQLALAKKFLLASGKLQALCYKEDIEAALRTPGMGGFQLLDLHDFPGQGTALVGVLDPFWEAKGYVSAAEFSRFCDSTVPLARLSKRVFTTAEKLEADLEVAHFGSAILDNALATWRLVSDTGKVVAQGELPPRPVPVDNAITLGRVSVGLRDIPVPARYKLIVALRSSADVSPVLPSTSNSVHDHERRGPRPTFVNDWDVWVYPPNLSTEVPAGVTVVDDLNDRVLAALDAGGKVLLLIPPSRVKGDRLGKVALGFSSIFWNTAWTRRQPPHTLGVLCDPQHPAFADFPTDSHSNWQWWYLVSRAGAMILDDLPPRLRPTVLVIDDWFTARRLGLLFEAKVGRGKLAVCSIDLQSDLASNPVARQFRHSLLRYVASDRFKPKVALTAEQVRSLMAPPSAMQKSGARVVRADSAEPDFEADLAIDGDANTIWHTAWTPQTPGFPHEIQIEFQQPLTIRCFTVLPRQDGNRNGWIKDYACYLSEDGESWGEPVAKGTFTDDASLKTVTLPKPCQARFLRLVALSGFGPGQWASVAELQVREAGE
ncbi:MAG: discoidin domain-containing protein [Verrucomicrobia bacterium]|nr:discoidin domain-containing protein [Verrucomicrobiota bacterium]